MSWTPVPVFRANGVRLQLFAPAHGVANFLRTRVLPQEVAHWTLTKLREKLIKIGAQIARRGRYVVFQLVEVALPRALLAAILEQIDRLRRPTMAVAA